MLHNATQKRLNKLIMRGYRVLKIYKLTLKLKITHCTLLYHNINVQHLNYWLDDHN